ncbi:hypothetical protein HDV00_008950, partial [Rhizophlyctis rosea]
MRTSNTFTQANGTLDLVNQGAGRIPFFTLEGFESNSLFTFDGAETLSIPFIKVTESFTLPDNYVPSVAYCNQLYQAGVQTAIDISAPVEGRRIVSVRPDFTTRTTYINPENQLAVSTNPEGPLTSTGGLGLDCLVDNLTIKKVPGLGLVGGYAAMYPLQILENEISLQVDDITIINSPVGLAANYKGMYPLQVLENEISLQVDDLTIINSPIGLAGNYRGGNGILIEENLISISPATEEKIDQTQAQTEELQAQTEEIQAQTEGIQAQTEEIQVQLEALTAQVEAMGGALAAESAAMQAEIGAALGAVVAEGIAITAEGALITAEIAEGQALISTTAASSIGAILAAAATAAGVGTLLSMLGKKSYTTIIYNITTVGTKGITNQGTAAGDSQLSYGFSIVPGNLYNATLYPYLNTAPCSITPPVGSNLAPVASTDCYSGQLTVYGGCGISGDTYVGGSVYSKNLRLATESF